MNRDSTAYLLGRLRHNMTYTRISDPRNPLREIIQFFVFRKHLKYLLASGVVRPRTIQLSVR